MENSANKRVFVAGASGAIGRRLCLLLVADGWRVTGTTRRPERAEELRAIGVEPEVVDVYDADALRKAVARARPSVVVHQLTDLPQGLEPSKMEEGRARNARIRDVGTRHLVAAAVETGARRIVAQSIAFAYAPGTLPYREDAPLASEALVAFERQVLDSGLEALVLRYGQLYGPGTGFDAAPKGAPVHVDAAADAARRAMARGEPGIYNVAEDDGTVSCVKAVNGLGWSPAFRRQG
jgi:nucleoside-diphosphate-sugar epimerase